METKKTTAMNNSNGMSDGVSTDMSEFGYNGPPRCPPLQNKKSKESVAPKVDAPGQLRITTTDWETPEETGAGRFLDIEYGQYSIHLDIPKLGGIGGAGIVMRVENEDLDCLRLEITASKKGFMVGMLNPCSIMVGPRTVRGWDRIEKLKRALAMVGAAGK